MNHQTRCPWVKQNDADSESQMPFLCGAAAAQMILYGRDDSRFVAPGSTQLDVSAAVRRQDQADIWQAIIAESQACTLPSGVHYDGTPEQEQVCEGTSFCWATFPKALEKTLDHGVPLASGPLAGVPASVRAVSSESSIEEAIMGSLDRGVAAALLIEGVHWVVVYRYDERDDGEVSIYYRDGLLPKVQSNAPIGVSSFESELTALTHGVFSGKYVAVTASSSVPVVTPEPHAMRRRRRRRRVVAPTVRERIPFPESLVRELPEMVARDDDWKPAFRGARTRFVLPTRLQSGRGPGYYLADVVTPRDGAGEVRTGSAIVDASTLRPILIAGIEEKGQELPPLLGPDEARRALDHLVGARQVAKTAWQQQETAAPPALDPASLRLKDELTWTMCDQSTSPFLPFYVVEGRDPRTGEARTLHLRADGRWLGELTWKMAGI